MRANVRWGRLRASLRNFFPPSAARFEFTSELWPFRFSKSSPMSRFDVIDAIDYPAPNFNAPNPRRILSSTLGRAGYAEMTAAIGDRRSRGRSRPDFIVSSGGGSYVRVTLRLLRITRGTTSARLPKRDSTWACSSCSLASAHCAALPWCAGGRSSHVGSRHTLHLRGAHLPGSRNSHPR